MSDDDKAKPDLSEIFDLKHTRAARDYVNGFMDLYRRREALAAEIKAVAESAKAAFTPVEIRALQRHRQMEGGRQGQCRCRQDRRATPDIERGQIRSVQLGRS